MTLHRDITTGKWNGKRRRTAGCLDKTGVGEGPYEKIKQFMRGMEGVTLTAQVKEDLMGKLKLALEQGKLTLPRDSSRLLVQITAQRCEPTISGTLKFSHPTGTHDDQLWALGLAVYANEETPPSRHLRPITRSFGQYLRYCSGWKSSSGFRGVCERNKM